MIDWTLTTILIASFVGGCIGFLSGVFGVGGGFLLVPVLNTVLGIPMSIAVGSTACYTLGPATTAMLSRRLRSGFIELPLILAGGLLAGVVCGAAALARLQTIGQMTIFGKSLPAVDLIVLLSYLVLMTGIGLLALWDGRRVPGPGIRRRGLLAFVPLPPMAVIPELRPGVYSIPLLAATGLGVGFLSGFLGMSGGLVLVPAAIYLLGLRAHDATTVTIVIVWLVSLQSAFTHALHQHIALELVVALLVCGAAGAALGSQVGMNLKGRQLKTGFGLLVLVAAAIVAARLAQLWLAPGP